MQRRNTKRKYAGADPGTWKRYKYNPKSGPTDTLSAKVNRLLNAQEKKWFDQDISHSFTNAVPSQISPLTNIPEGVDESERIGRKVSVQSVGLTFRSSFTTPPAGEYVEAMRAMIVCDMQGNGTAPTITDILEENRVDSFMNLNNQKRFKIIYDNYCMRGKGDNFDALSLSGGNGLQFYDKMFRKVDTEMVFPGSLTTPPNTGGYYLVTIAGGNLTTGTTLSLTAKTRVRYTDA